MPPPPKHWKLSKLSKLFGEKVWKVWKVSKLFAEKVWKVWQVSMFSPPLTENIGNFPMFWGGDTGRRVKEVRFGKLAFLQLNGAILPQKRRFSAISHYVFSKLVLWHGNRAHLRVLRHILWIGSSCPKPYLTEPSVPVDHLSRKNGSNFFTENVARNSLKSHFFGPKTWAVLL